MKTKYYVPTGDHSVKLWMIRDGVDYYCTKELTFIKLTNQGVNWKKLKKRRVVREVKIEELALL